MTSAFGAIQLGCGEASHLRNKSMLKSLTSLAVFAVLPVVPIATFTLNTRPAKAATFNLIEATIPEIQAAIEAELITSEYLVQQYLNR
ncbi:MAG: hypothetical protein AAFW75_31515, partial [Cyanobacteria bacterium J06636_16]